MLWSTWVGFVVACAVMGAIPGPGVISIVGYAVGSGRKVALASVAGMAVGNTVAISLSLAGVGTLLAASALTFAIVKWTGAFYLVGLGIVSLARAGTGEPDEARQPMRGISPRAAFLGNVAVGTFHPKTIVFFVAFVPQFIRPEGSYLLQATILSMTFCCVVAGTDTLYAVAASRASGLLRRPRLLVWSRRAGGGVLIAAGVATAAARN